MNKILRVLFLALLAIFTGNVMAEDIIWSEDFSSYAKGDVPAGGTYSYACVNGESTTKIYEENLAGGISPELLVSKVNGSFSAVIPLGDKSGNMSLAFKCNKNITVSVSVGTLGEATITGNDYIYPITGATGTLTITFSNTLNSNARLDNIKLYQGESKKPAGLSWGKSTATVELGNADGSYQYIPTLQNDNNLGVTCTSTETSVATVTNEGVVTVVGKGKTIITASFAGNDEYEAAEISFTLTVNAPAGEVEEITVAKALELISALADNGKTEKEYKVKGYIVGTPEFQRNGDNVLYGNVNTTIADEKGGTTTLTIYRAKSFNNEKFTEETISFLKEGDEVVFQGKLQKYVKDEKVTPEVVSGYLFSVNGKTAGVNIVKATANADAPAYNLAGQKVADGFKGLVIKNGKKYMMK